MLTSDDLMGIIYTEAFDTWTGEQLMFMDATCPRCGKRIGWYGDVSDRPPCGGCGHQISPEATAADQAAMDEFREILAGKAGEGDGPTLARNRELAGLSVGQAAKLLRIPRSVLERIESGESTPGQDLRDLMGQIYGGASQVPKVDQ